jgi:transcription antitermination factor NusA-like protein
MKNKRPPRAVFENVNSLKAQDIQSSEILKTLLKKEVPESIEYAIENKKTFASIFEINDSNCYIELHRNQWIQALETCILFYIEEEDYESCNKITKLIEKVKKKPKKVVAKQKL